MVLPRSMRLKGHKCIDYIYKQGSRYHSPLMILRVAESNTNLLKKINSGGAQATSLKFAISISKKVSKKAVRRNKLRRVLHEHLRKKLIESYSPSKSWALLSLKPNSAQENPLTLIEEFDKLLLKAQLIR